MKSRRFQKLLKAIRSEPQSLTALGILEISKNVENYLQHRIESDKVIEGLLQDIYNGIDALKK